MDEHTRRERQRLERESRAQERVQRQAEIELQERIRELRRLRESAERQLRETSLREEQQRREEQHSYYIEQAQEEQQNTVYEQEEQDDSVFSEESEDIDDLEVIDNIGYDYIEEPSQRTLSYREESPRRKSSLKTPSFLRRPELEMSSSLRKSSTPNNRLVKAKTEKVSPPQIQIERHLANSERSLVKETGQSFPETDMLKKIEDLRWQTEQLAMKSQQRILDESKMNVKTWPIAERQRELRTQIERPELTSNRGQTISPQTEMFTLNTEQDVQDSSLPIKEECISGDIQRVQNEEQADLRRYIRELEDRLLKHKKDEEAKEIDRLAKLQKQEAEMRKEMEEREKKWKYEKEADYRTVRFRKEEKPKDFECIEQPGEYESIVRNTEPNSGQTGAHPKVFRDIQIDPYNVEKGYATAEKKSQGHDNYPKNTQEAEKNNEKKHQNHEGANTQTKNNRDKEYSMQRELELNRKEQYLKELEKELNQKENKIRKQLHLQPLSEGTSGSLTPESDTLDASTYIETAGKRTDANASRNQEITHVIKPFISTFSGSEPVPQKEVCFDDWKLETNYLIKSSPYPDIMINQAIRNSLRGKARKVVNTLNPDVTAAEIIDKLDSVFGNVASGESVVQEFYNSYQRSNESTTLWGIRLEELFEKAKEKGHVVNEQKEKMLKNKFWRGLYKTDLKNATRVYFVSEKIDFETLRRKVRAEEYEISQERKVIQKDGNTEIKQLYEIRDENKENKVKLQHQQIETETNNQLLVDMKKRMEELEKTISDFRKKEDHRPDYRGRPSRGRGGNSMTYRNRNNRKEPSSQSKNNLNQ